MAGRGWSWIISAGLALIGGAIVYLDSSPPKSERVGTYCSAGCGIWVDGLARARAANKCCCSTTR